MARGSGADGTEHEFRAQPTEVDLPGAGLRIHALDWGLAPGPTILFLHGGGLNAHTWDVVCDALRDDFRCLALDLRGHGDSDWDDAGDYSLAAHVADLRSVIGALVPGRFVLVGMSVGALVGLSYAAEDPDGLLGLVMVDAGPDGSRPAGRGRLQAFMTERDEYASVDEIIDRAMTFNPRRSRERLSRTLQNNLRETERGTWTWKYDPRIRRLPNDPALTPEEVERRWAERRRTLWAAIPRVTCPTLIVRGGESDMFLDEDAERAAAALPNGRWIRIEGASHTVQSDRPYELATAIRHFVPAP